MYILLLYLLNNYSTFQQAWPTKKFGHSSPMYILHFYFNTTVPQCECVIDIHIVWHFIKSACTTVRGEAAQAPPAVTMLQPRPKLTEHTPSSDT